MTYDMQTHWQALYNATRTGLDTDGFSAYPLVHVFTGDTTLITSYSPPVIQYRQEVERRFGTTGSGAIKVMRSNWIFTAYTEDLEDGLDATTSIINALTDAALTTTDGYTTTALFPIGVQSLYETDAKVYATHLRMEWERSS